MITSKKLLNALNIASKTTICYNNLTNARGFFHFFIVTVDEFVEIVKLQYGSKTPNIRLISCLAGVLSNGVAQQMADKLHVKVLAAQGVVAVDVEGEVSVLDPVTSETIDNEKAWKCFCPKESE